MGRLLACEEELSNPKPHSLNLRLFIECAAHLCRSSNQFVEDLKRIKDNNITTGVYIVKVALLDNQIVSKKVYISGY
jgi:hypothetical protein